MMDIKRLSLREVDALARQYDQYTAAGLDVPEPIQEARRLVEAITRPPEDWAAQQRALRGAQTPAPRANPPPVYQMLASNNRPTSLTINVTLVDGRNRTE